MNAIVVAVLTWAAKAGAKAARILAARKVLDSVPKPQGVASAPPHCCPRCGASLWYYGKNYGLCRACDWPGKVRPLEKAGASILALALMGTQLGCAVWNRVPACQKLEIARQLACPADTHSAECIEAESRLAAECGVKPVDPPVNPPVSDKPPVPPVVEPPAPPEQPPVVEPLPDWTHPTSWDVKAGPHGQGVDSTTTAHDCTYCAGQGFPADRCGCPLVAEGNTTMKPDRQTRELELMGGCPTWQFYTATRGSASEPLPCLEVDPYDTGGMSCDHFGTQPHQDDPKTAAFEGEPAVCGAQRDADGHPKAGFFTVAHGDGWVRACDAVGDHCGNWVRVVH